MMKKILLGLVVLALCAGGWIVYKYETLPNPFVSADHVLIWNDVGPWKIKNKPNGSGQTYCWMTATYDETKFENSADKAAFNITAGDQGYYIYVVASDKKVVTSDFIKISLNGLSTSLQKSPVEIDGKYFVVNAKISSEQIETIFTAMIENAKTMVIDVGEPFRVELKESDEAIKTMKACIEKGRTMGESFKLD